MAKILIVDDYQWVRDLYSNLLSKKGHRVDTAVDGEEGLRKMLRGGYDLILLDLLMPKLTGLQVLKKYGQQNPDRPNGKILILSVASQDNLISQALRQGASSYLVKSTTNPGKTVSDIEKQLE